MRYILSVLFALAFVATANAQICNTGSPFLVQNGPIILGHLLQLGPNCNQVQDGGGGTGTNLLVTNNIWTGNNYFKTGYPWADVRAWGAVGDGVTNDTVAVQNAINSLSATGGTVFFPPGTGGQPYCVNGGVSVTSGSVRLAGAGTEQPTVVSACGANVTPITLNSFGSGLERLFVQGSQLGATFPAVQIGISCVECYVAHNKIEFGSTPLNVAGSDNLFFDNVVEFGYGIAAVYVTGSNYFDKLKADQPYPVSTPIIGAAPSARANLTPYTTGQIVSLAGYYIQATNNGTSGGGAPSLQNYNINIVDGSVTWKLVAPVTYNSLQIDTGVTIMTLRNSDHTGAFNHGIFVSNSLAGVAPQSIFMDSIIVGSTLGHGILFNAGDGIIINKAQITSCLITACAGIQAAAAFTGDATISNSLIFTNPIGINVTNGAGWIINSNQIFNSSVAGIIVQGSLSKITINDNNLGASAVWGTNFVGLQLGAGATDYLDISNNIVQGATTPYINGGVTGTHNSIRINNDQFGTITNDNAPAGAIGEFLSNTVLVGSAVSLVNNTAKDVTSQALTAGDYDVDGNICLNPNAATTMSQWIGWISTTSATAPTAPNSGAYFQLGLTFSAGQPQCAPVGTIRISLAAAGTAFLSTLATFATNTQSAYGFIRIRRVR